MVESYSVLHFALSENSLHLHFAPTLNCLVKYPLPCLLIFLLMLTWIGMHLSPFPFPLVLFECEAKRESAVVPRSAEGRFVGPFPLRPLLRRRESGGTPDLCPRCVNSRIRFPNGAGEVEVTASFWNKLLEFDLHPGGASRSVVGEFPARVPPGSSDLVRLRASGVVFMAELKTVHGSFCPSIPSPTWCGSSWPGRGDSGGGVVWSWCLLPALPDACTGGGRSGASEQVLPASSAEEAVRRWWSWWERVLAVSDHRFRFRRCVAGGSCGHLKVWRCSQVADEGWCGFFCSGDGGGVAVLLCFVSFPRLYSVLVSVLCTLYFVLCSC